MLNRTRISLSPEELSLAVKGTTNILAALSVYMNGTTFSTPYPVFGWPKNTGDYTEGAGSSLRSLHQKLIGPYTGRKKVRLSLFEISALAFAIRVATKKILHGDYQWEGTAIKVLRKGLSEKLEKYRKRALRRFLSSRSKNEYIAARDQQQQFFVWLRIHVLYCWCNFRYPLKPQRYYRLGVKTLARFAAEALQEAGYRPLDRAALHRVVRLALQQIRRGRVYLGVREILKNPELAKIHFLGFIEERYELSPIS